LRFYGSVMVCSVTVSALQQWQHVGLAAAGLVIHALALGDQSAAAVAHVQQAGRQLCTHRRGDCFT